MDRRGAWVSVGLVALALALTPGCGGGDSASAASKDDSGLAANAKPGAAGEEKKEEAIPVEVAVLERGPIESVLRLSTNLEAESSVQVFAQAKRLVVDLRVEEGHRVKKGDLLLRLQDDEQQSALAKAESQYDKAKAEHERQQRLYAQELISEQAWLDATHQLDQLEIALDDARRELGYAEVRAPISGTITRRLVNRGDQVQIGQHLFDLVDFDSLIARVYVPEKHLAQLAPGLDARISSQALAGRDYRGDVARIAPVVDPKSGTVKVTIAVGGQPGLRPGMYADVDLVLETRDEALLVPKRALVHDNDQAFVYRLKKDRRVERVFVEPVLADRDHVEPRDGLAAGDRIVVAGQAGLKNGALVRLPGEKPQDTGATESKAEQRASL